MSARLTRLDEVEDLLHDGMTIGIGGWGSRRKPLALVRAVVRSGVRDLTVVSFGGPDVGILCATGQARQVTHGFVSLDSIPVDPHFAARRQRGGLVNVELDEAMLVAGLRAASRRLPFEVTRAGAGSDAVLRNPHIRTIVSPYADGEELVAMPAIPLDLALLHLDRADARGTALCLGPDVFFDDLFSRAAACTVVSVEEVVPTAELLHGTTHTTAILNRSTVDHVVLSPGGAGFTAHPPYAERDEALQRAYAAAADSDAAWQRFRDRFLAVDEVEYRRAVAHFSTKAAS